MKSVLLKSHEEYWLQAGYVLCLQFDGGWVCFRITGREPSNIEPFNLATRVATLSNLTAWNTIQDALGNRYLEPYDTPYINQIFWGVSPPLCRVYMQYAIRQDRMNLISMQRLINGDIGYVDGKKSPLDGPFSPKTEMWTVYQVAPAFNVYNPLSQTMFNILMSFDIMRYTYKVITDKTEVKSRLLGDKPRHMHTVGGIDPSPVVEPDWLRKLNVASDNTDLWAWTKKGMEDGVWS